jgi:membrane associated rhomboid family serine protease
MANIHGVGDNRQGLLGGSDRNEALMLSGVGIGTAAEARSETFLYMMKLTISPYYVRRSFTSLIALINLGFFLLCVFYGTEAGRFLIPTTDALSTFGAMDTDKLRKFQLWRYITAVFNHGSFTHIAYNTLTTFFIVTRLEHSLQAKQTALVYFVSAIGGNAFSSFMNKHQITCGASTALCGVLGAILGWIAGNWSGLERYQSRLYSAFFYGFLLVFVLISGGMDHKADGWGHLGGAMTGICLGVCYLPAVGAGPARTYKLASVAGLFLIVLGSIMGFYLT